MSRETAGVRQIRLAENEALFREVNERIAQIAEQWGSNDDHFNFVCECSHADCAAQLELSRTAYEQVRAHPARFVLAKGHEVLEVDAVMDTLGSYVIVEKIEGAEGVARATDQRTND
jgi:hypothetical protein